MIRNRGQLAVASLALGLLVGGGLVGCSDAQAEPLELTYYYLPG